MKKRQSFIIGLLCLVISLLGQELANSATISLLQYIGKAAFYGGAGVITFLIMDNIIKL